jgi:hypothetical protein
VTDIVERLRACLSYDEPNWLESEIEAAARVAANEIEGLRDLIREAIDELPAYMDGRNDDLLDRMAKAIGEFVEDDE